MKKTGKALSLVLSMALVVSSLAMTASASATASKSEYLPADTNTTVIDLVNGKSGSASQTILDAIHSSVSNVATKDHLDVGTLNITEVAHKSGDSLASYSVDTNNKNVTAKLNSDAAIGSEVIAVRYTAEDFRYTDVNTKINFSYEKDFKVNVHKLNSLSLDITDASSKNATGNSFTGTVDKWIVDSTKVTAACQTSRLAVTAQQNVWTAASATKSGAAQSAAVGEYVIKVASDGGNNITTSDASDHSQFTANLTTKGTNVMLTVGSTTFYATPVKTAATASADAVLDTANTIVGYGKVPNTVLLTGCAYITTWRGATWAIPASNTPVSSETDSTKSIPCTGALNVTGCNIKLTGTTIMDKGSVATVSGGQSFTMNGGSVASISDTNSVTTIIVNNGMISGAVNASTEADIYGGTTGSVTAPTVKVDSLDEKVPTHTGNITANTVTVNSQKAAVATGTITKNGNDGTVEGGPADETANAITIAGTQTNVASIDCDNYKTTVDLKGFNGTMATPLNSSACTLKTEANGDANTTATVTGNVSAAMIDVENGTLTIANSATVDYVSGIGTLVIPAGALKVNKAIGTVSLRLSNDKIVTGMTALYAPAYVVYDGSFKTVGYSLDYDAVNTGTKTGLQPFNIKTVSFASLSITPASGTSNKIAVGQKATFNVSTYPSGTALPDDTAIRITFNGSSDNFSYTTTDNSITISATKYETLFNSLNKGTITATLVNKSDPSVEKFGFDPITYDVQMIAKPETVYTSDTTADKTIKVGEQYTYKITSSDGSDPAFGFGTDGIAKIIKTSKTTSGTTAFYYYTIQGMKEGAAGAYTNTDKAKVNVVTVKGSVYKSDTSTVTIATGHHYTFKITADKNAAAPVFQVCTFSAKNTVLTKTTKNADGSISYEYTVTANGSPVGAHGAYVNGVSVATVTVK